MTVDGRWIGWVKYVSNARPVVFDGWLEREGGALRASRDTKPSTYREFLFGKPQQTDEEGTLEAVATQGLLRVTIQPSMATGVKLEHAPTKKTAAPASKMELPSLPGKKFFMAPSLTAEAGEVLVRNTTWSTTSYAPVGPPLADIKLHYETASTLLLRKVLDPLNPQHRTILAAAGLGEDEEAGGSGEENDVPEPSARRRLQDAFSTAGGSSQGSADKRRKRGSQAPAASNAAPIDLTDVVRIKREMPKMQGVAKDEVLVCDLTDEGPVWEAKKKARVQQHRPNKAGGESRQSPLPDANRIPLPEVSHNGQTYVVAKECQSFLVKVTARSSALFAVSLTVDGQTPGYRLTVTHGTAYWFDGWLDDHTPLTRAQREMQPSVFRGFRFGKVRYGGAPGSTSSAHGKLCLTVTRVAQGAVEPDLGYQAKAPVTKASVPSIEGKKFFMAPSLTFLYFYQPTNTQDVYLKSLYDLDE
ncbi:hypothetical protein WJX72_005788 [[Myrmecia] bisecta]|uniref:Uncharacterized protein n=1 Tax=[Myrmecia] bisecta TaxID=41462 RepID=A0AAW1PHK4_9CHLO